jgi:hypothetical protein
MNNCSARREIVHVGRVLRAGRVVSTGVGAIEAMAFLGESIRVITKDQTDGCVRSFAIR